MGCAYEDHSSLSLAWYVGLSRGPLRHAEGDLEAPWNSTMALWTESRIEWARHLARFCIPGVWSRSTKALVRQPVCHEREHFLEASNSELKVRRRVLGMCCGHGLADLLS